MTTRSVPEARSPMSLSGLGSGVWKMRFEFFFPTSFIRVLITAGPTPSSCLTGLPSPTKWTGPVDPLTKSANDSSQVDVWNKLSTCSSDFNKTDLQSLYYPQRRSALG